MVASVIDTALHPMSKSGLSADPARPMMGMNIMNVAYVMEMLRTNGTKRDRR